MCGESGYQWQYLAGQETHQHSLWPVGKLCRIHACCLRQLCVTRCPRPPAAAYAEGVKRMTEGISRIGIISLVSAADTAAPAPPMGPPGLGLRRDPSGALGGGSAQQLRPKAGVSASALELAAAPYAAPLTAAAADNQKLLLLAAFLQVRRVHVSRACAWVKQCLCPAVFSQPPIRVIYNAQALLYLGSLRPA